MGVCLAPPVTASLPNSPARSRRCAVRWKYLAAAYAPAGQLDDAEWEREEVLISNPQFSLQNIERAFPFKDPKDREHFITGLRKAGFS